MNGKSLAGKTLYVSYLMSREQRKHMLNSVMHTNNPNKQQMGYGQGVMQYPQQNRWPMQQMPNMPMPNNMQMPMGMPMNMPPMGMQGMPQMGGMQQTQMRAMKGVRNPQNLNPSNQPPNIHNLQQNSNNAQTDNWDAKKKSFNHKYFNTLQRQEEKCQYLGEIFWPYVALRDPE